MTSITSDASSSVYAIGYTRGDLDGHTSTSCGACEDFFVVKYDSSGGKQWTQQLGTSTSNSTIAYGIATDSCGNVYVMGYTGGALDGNTSAGSSDLFVLKYNSSGARQWTQQLVSSANDQAKGIATDTIGNVYVTVVTYGALDGNTMAGNTMDPDFFVVKYDSSGVKQWTKQLETSAVDFGEGIATDSSGNVYMTGSTSLGLDGNTSAGNQDLFVVKYDINGVKQ